MPPPKPAVPAAAQPKFGDFDVWNSSSTGHQRAERNLGSGTEWRQSRTMKLSHQFKSSGTGGKRISNLVGARPQDWDEELKALVRQSAEWRANLSVGNILNGKENAANTSSAEKLTAAGKAEDDLKEDKRNGQKGVFDGLVVFINGSTYPLISDHKLKILLVENGAKLSQHLGRRQVSHVILGRPSGTQGMGAGGGLAGTKIEKEIRRIGGCGVKYVGVEWVLESMTAGKRLSETPFANLKVAAKGQQSVYNVFMNRSSSGTSTGAA